MEEGRAIAYGKCIQRVNACMDGRRTLRYYIHSALPARSRGRVHIQSCSLGPGFGQDVDGAWVG